jgi:hypothetical protein
MERAVLVGLLLSVSLSSGTALALDRGRTLAQFHHTGWIAEDGAPSQVSALAQTADGFVWSVLVYVHGVRAVTGLDTIHAALGVAAPAAIMALLSFLATAGLLAFIYALLF